MEPEPSRGPLPDALSSGDPPMSPDSSGGLSPFDLCGDIELGPGSPPDDGVDGAPQDGSSGQRSDSNTEIAEQAKHEAEIENRIAELRKEGFWTPRRLSKYPEPTRPKVLWDYLCEEMQWLAADFGQERRWKRGVARKVVRMVVRHHEELKQKEERARREEQAKLRRIATSIAKEVRQFWSNVEKVVQFKQQSRLEEKRKKALDLQLDFIVGQTEKYSDLLSQSLSEAVPVSKTSSSCVGSSQGDSVRTSPVPSLRAEGDGDFLPHGSEGEAEDDEETIEMEELQEGNDAETHRLELELLQQESKLPLDELLQSLPPEILQEDSPLLDPVTSEEDTEEDEKVGEEDEEFTANEEEAEDEEDTIAAEEEMAGQQDHTEELSQLAREGEMSLDELLLRYSALPSEQESDSAENPEDYDSDCDSSGDESEGVEFLVKPDDDRSGSERLTCEPPEPKKEITDIAATAESLQPKGYTLATTQVKTSVPFLLRGELREYQHIGLEWLVTMYEKKLNGILADEMGLGKTIQTISLLAHLACERGNWGPHLIIVPTSVILNWEMELKRWCPSFKILTYYGSQKERKLKRQGWTKSNAFHVCITSYKLVLQDHQAFRRKNWKYLILDEAQNIKNFKSQRWQSLLNFNSQRRLLLTGTPLQNSLMELWSLMHFLMPHVFQSHREFKEWFSNPLTGMIEGSQEYNEGLVRRLHKVLRPFLLRRIKLDVEKQMPKKYEHVIYCRLSKRQRFLYDDFMAQAATRETLASGHFMSVINILMQLRKVCNHPNLFDPRPIHSPFITSGICYAVPSLVLQALQRHPLEYIDTSWFDLVNLEGRVSRYERDVFLPRYKPSRTLIQEIADSPEPPPRPRTLKMKVNRSLQPVKPDPRSVVVNNPRPIQKSPDVLSSPQPPAPPSLPSSSCPPAPALVPALKAPLTVQSGPVPPSVTPMSNGAGKPVPVQNTQPVCSAPQRLILTPDTQARLPSGEVISLAQLASLSGRPLQGAAATKPLTLQLQGTKLTLSGAPVRPMGVGQPRPVQGNVLHLVSSGGHLLSQPAQLALLQALAQQSTPPAPPVTQLVPNNTQAQIGVQAVSVQSLQHPLLNSSGLPAASPSQVPTSGVVKIVVRQPTREIAAAPHRPPVAPPLRPLLRVIPGPPAEQSPAREGAAQVASASTLSLAASPLLMMSSPAVTARLPSPSTAQPSVEECPGPPVSGVALRILTTSAAVQLTNHNSPSPRHIQSPAIPNCSGAPSSATPGLFPETAPGLVVVKPLHNPEASAGPLDMPPVLNGNGTAIQSLPNPSTSSDNALYVNLIQNPPPSPPASSIPKMAPAPPTYNLSLVPALLANSSPATVPGPYPLPARFLTSPVSLLTLSPLASSSSGPSPVLYTPPNAPVSAPLPLLAAPVSFTAPLPISTTSQSSMAPSLSESPFQLPRTSPILPVSAPAASPIPSLPAAGPAPSPAPLVLEAPGNQPLILSSDPVPLLEASESLPPLVLNTSSPVPVLSSPVPVLSSPVPVLSSPVPVLSSPVPVLSSPGTVPFLASAKMPLPIVNASSNPSTTFSQSRASAFPLLASAGSSGEPVSSHSILIPAPISLAPLRQSAPITSLTFTSPGSVTSVAASPLPAVVAKIAALPPVASDAPMPASSLLPPVAADAQVLPALEPAEGSPLVQPVISAFSQSPLPCLSLRIPAPQPSLPISTQSPSMPAPAPAPMPSLPASTPVPLPLLPASTPAPMSSLPACSLDPASLLLGPTPGPHVSSPAPVDTAPTSLLPPSSAGQPLVISFSAPSSHIPLLPALPPQAPVTTVHPNVTPKPVPLVPSPVPTAVSPPLLPVPSLAPEPSLSLSEADPQAVGMTLGSESERTMEADELRPPHNPVVSVRLRRQLPPPPRSPFYLEPLEERRRNHKLERLERIFHLNERRSNLAPVYGSEVLRLCTLQPGAAHMGAMRSCMYTAQQRLEQLAPIIERFIFAMPPVEAPQITLHTSHPPPSLVLEESLFKNRLSGELTPHTRCLHRIISNMRTQFPDLRLIQYDCGKLQTLDRLLRQLKSGGHRVLLFTQMTRMLDILEQFLNYHGHIYLRLDGSTRVEQRQVLMERFNMDKRIFCFILSTRSGGVGVNLTGADTVIFYDSDWNPTMDAQAQDRCHRIGQTRDVHIYRLVSERTVEENILKKAQQKRLLGDMAIEGGNFTTAYFKQQSIRELFDMEETSRKESEVRNASPDDSAEEGATSRQAHILEQALCGAEDEEDTLAASLVRAEQVADLAEFNENVPLEPEEEEPSRAEQEISALVEQLTPIERYAMCFLEASLEEVSKEELKQAEEQVEAARKDLFLAKDEVGLMTEVNLEEEARRSRKVKTPVLAKNPERIGVRMSERLRGSKPSESLDPTVGPTISDVALPSQEEEVKHENPSPTLNSQATPEPEDASTSAEIVACTSPIIKELSTALPPIDMSETDSAPNGIESEMPTTEVAVMDNVVETGAVPGSPVGAVPGSPVGAVPGSPVGAVPGSPVGAVPGSPVPPRTPRKKVFADCEITLAGATETSPTAKVLRRLPGRLVTVVQERIPTPRRQNKGNQTAAENESPSPCMPAPLSPSHDRFSEETSETGSPPPKRKRGRPPKTRAQRSVPSVHKHMVMPDCSASMSHDPGAASDLASTSIQTSVSPNSTFKVNSDSESGSPIEKRKRGRPPKRREVSPIVSSPLTPKTPEAPPVVAPPASPKAHDVPLVVAQQLSSKQCDDPVSVTSLVPPHRDSAPAVHELDTKQNLRTSELSPAADSIIPSVSSDIPILPIEGTSSSGVEEPLSPPKRKRGRPPKCRPLLKVNSSPVLLNDTLDSSPERSASPQVTRTSLQRKCKPFKAEFVETKEQNSSLADNDDSSDEEVIVRTPLTRSGRTRPQTTNQTSPAISPNSAGFSKSPRGRSPRTVPIQEKCLIKKRKPPSVSSPSPSSSPHGSSSESRKRPCPPAERVLRSSLTANPASNTRSSRSPLLKSPNSHRGRKAKT
ncbi:helicase SRCAP isoform X2 [Engystomops pustulosus]